MIRRLLAVSPHLDDAAFSVGGTLAAMAQGGWAVTILTCFTGNVDRPEGFALACQLDKGLGPEVDYMALRRAEDRAACAVIGAQPVHLPFLEAPHRGYESPAALFGAQREDDLVAPLLAAALAGAIADLRPDLILGPLALGDHVDHRVVRQALGEASRGRYLLLWEDWPYADRPSVTRPAGAARRLALEPWMRERRLAMCQAYRSQIGYQFGSRDALASRIRALGHERLHRAP